MLDKIMESIGGNVANQIAGKAGISLDQATQMLPMATESLQEGLMSQVSGGNVSGLLGMFQSASSNDGSLMNNSIFDGIKSMFMKKVMTNMGLPESVAGLAAGTGMSSIMGSLAGKMVEDGDTDEIDSNSIMNVLGGGGGVAGMLGNLASNFLGSNKENNDGGMMDNVKDAAMDKLKDGLGGLFK